MGLSLVLIALVLLMLALLRGSALRAGVRGVGYSRSSRPRFCSVVPDGQAGAGGGEGVAVEPEVRRSPSFASTTFSVSNLPDETIYLIDGTALLYNAYYSREHKSDYSDAEFTELLVAELSQTAESQALLQAIEKENGKVGCGALTAMSMIFSRFVRDVRPKYVAVAFDTGRPTFRADLYAEYKAGRKAPPDDLQILFNLAPRILTALGARCFQVAKFEADDVMATLSRWSRGRGLNVVHVSVDKDMLQLVDAGVHVMHIKTKAMFGVDEVTEKYGVSPAQLIELQALTGDASDNIRGVPGIGPKTAAALLSHFDNIARLYEEVGTGEEVLKSVAGLKRHKAVYNYLRDCDYQSVLFMKHLLTLRDDVPLVTFKLFGESSAAWDPLPLAFDGDAELASLTTAFFRYRGERSTDAAISLLDVSPSLEKPLNLLRRAYGKLDRIL